MEKPSPERLIAALKKAGLRITPQRIAICKLLAETDHHPTAMMIFEEIRRIYPSLSLTTVYNTLDALAELGAVNILGHAGDNTIHYDANLSPHANLACTVCHKIVDIETPTFSNLKEEIRAASGFQLLGERVVYYGLCPACQVSKSL